MATITNAGLNLMASALQSAGAVAAGIVWVDVVPGCGTLASALNNGTPYTSIALNAGLPVFDVSTLESRISAVTFGLRMAGLVSSAFGLLTLALASVGIYGVVACNTRQRTRELGLRMALGAQTTDVMRLILRQGGRMLLAGTVIGLAAALAATRLMGHMLFSVTATDPLTYLVVPILLAAVTLGACYLPARRAVRLDPLVALRHE